METPISAEICKTDMDRVNRIWQHTLFQEEYAGILKAEETRVYCGHGLNHLLDTARLMWIYVLEKHADFNRDIIYAAALLHDIGRAEQYRKGTPHQEAGRRIAQKILPECGYTESETDVILSAIASHREQKIGENRLGEILYMADKASRNCFACQAAEDCNWPDQKRNYYIKA